MDIHVTCFPIDQEFMADLGIYNNSKISQEALGDVLLAFVDAGYTNIQPHVATYRDGTKRLNFHCKMVNIL